MLTRSNSVIVLRKIGGRFDACWSATRAVAGVRTGGAVSPLTGLFAALLPVLLVVLTVAASVYALLHGQHATGFALATAPVAADAKAIRDEILAAFEEFKKTNDQRLAEVAKSGEASAETTAKVDRINDAIADMQAKMTRLSTGAGSPVEGEMDAETKKKVQAFFHPSADDQNRQQSLTFAFGGRKEIQAAQGVGSSGAGGAIVAPAFSNRLEKALLFFSGMMQSGEVMTTETGVDLPWPTVNDTTQQGAILAENAQIAAQDVTFSSVTLHAYKYTSKLIAVSWELLQDAAFDIEGMVADLAGERLGRILNNHFTVGSGSSQPNGAVTAASSGKVGTTGQTTSVIYDDLIDLIHSVDIAYRAGSKFMLSDSALKAVRKLKDSQNRPLWEPSVQAGQPDTLLGYPVVINNDVAVMAANAKSILFGDFSRYKIRRVRDIQLVRLNERYADNLQTGFFAYARFDGNLINAGTNPLKYYANSAT